MLSSSITSEKYEFRLQRICMHLEVLHVQNNIACYVASGKNMKTVHITTGPEKKLVHIGERVRSLMVCDNWK